MNFSDQDQRARDGVALEQRLSRAELEIYLGTAGFDEAMLELEQAALALALPALAQRAALLRSEALSRAGNIETSLPIQLEVLGAAERAGDMLIAARAQCALASSYFRLADEASAQAAATASVQQLPDDAPAHWPAEHMMTLALYTSYGRRHGVDFAFFDEALALARALGEPLMLLAVLNNYAYVALMLQDARALPLAEEFAALCEAELGDRCPSNWLDTIAVGMLAAGELDAATATIERAIEKVREDRLEPDSEASFLLTAATIDHAAGRMERARDQAINARVLALAAGDVAAQPAAQALKLLAELDAAAGNYRDAYERLQQYVDEWDRARSERADLHAATVQAIYGTQVERQRRLALEQIATSDSLTGLRNRRYLNDHLDALLAAPLAFAMLDIDSFKEINDRFSHGIGDQVLRLVAEICATAVTQFAGDAAFCARLGGDELVLVLPALEERAARDCCQQIRDRVQARRWDELASGLQVSVSVGLVISDGGQLTAPELLTRADAQMYVAKRAGKNIVAVERLDLASGDDEAPASPGGGAAVPGGDPAPGSNPAPPDEAGAASSYTARHVCRLRRPRRPRKPT